MWGGTKLHKTTILHNVALLFDWVGKTDIWINWDHPFLCLILTRLQDKVHFSECRYIWKLTLLLLLVILVYYSLTCFSLFHWPLIRLSVQLRRTSDGRLANSKANGPALGVRSGSLAVMLMPLGSGFSHISTSGGKTWGALSFMSSRYIWRVPVPLAGGIPAQRKTCSIFFFCSFTKLT